MENLRYEIKKCRRCHQFYEIPEEKQTDVNIAIKLFKLALQDRYDTAIIISGDSDLIPAIQEIKRTFPNKKFGILIPIGRRSDNLKDICDFHMKIKEKHLKASRFENEIELDNGKKLVCPPNWQ